MKRLFVSLFLFLFALASMGYANDMVIANSHISAENGGVNYITFVVIDNKDGSTEMDHYGDFESDDLHAYDESLGIMYEENDCENMGGCKDVSYEGFCDEDGNCDEDEPGYDEEEGAYAEDEEYDSCDYSLCYGDDCIEDDDGSYWCDGEDCDWFCIDEETSDCEDGSCEEDEEEFDCNEDGSCDEDEEEFDCSDGSCDEDEEFDCSEDGTCEEDEEDCQDGSCDDEFDCQDGSCEDEYEDADMFCDDDGNCYEELEDNDYKEEEVSSSDDEWVSRIIGGLIDI